ncbi:hypothetical protein ACN47E_002663 [Coniothyrium glycines]
MCMPYVLAAVLALAASTKASPLLFNESAHGPVGHVADAQGKVYTLRDTAPDIRVIADKVDGQFVRPTIFDIGPEHTCNFYSESTRGVGYLIGQYKGPASGTFAQKDWAAFYECWKNTEEAEVDSTDSEVMSRQTKSIPCGYALTSDGMQLTMSEGKGRYPFEFAVNGVKYIPSKYHIADHCSCDFFGPHGRSGYVAILKTNGPTDGQFKEKVWGYTCQQHN